MVVQDIFMGQKTQIIAGLAATVSAISDGMQYGWTAPIIQIFQSDNSPVQIQQSDIVWLENAYLLGGLTGLPITIFTVNKFGRKPTILIAAVLNLLSWIVIGFSPSVIFLCIARFVSGMAGAVSFVSVPMYIGEIADQNIRGFLGTFILVMLQIGLIVIYSVGPFVSIPVSSAVAGFSIILQLISFPFMPESPYFLLLQKKPEEARKSLQMLRSSQDVEKELVELQAAVVRQSGEKGRIIDLVLIDSNRKALLIVTVLNAAQQFSSFSVMLMNIHAILGDADSILQPNTAAIIFSVILLFAAILSSTTIDKAGRKMLLALSSAMTGISLLALAAYFTVKNSGTDVSTYNWVPVVAVMVFAATYRYGLGMVPMVLLSELFPTSVKAMGMAISDFMYDGFAIVAVYIFQKLGGVYGMQVPFFIFAVTSILTALFTIVYIPETKGKTLEEIQMILKGVKPNLLQKKLSTRKTMEGIINKDSYQTAF